MNKYNVRAIRKELDDCVRNRNWNKLHSKLKTLESKPELLQAVVLSKSKLASGSLLHALVQHHHSCHPTVFSVISIAKAAPQCLLVQDSRLQTPLHIAIGWDHCFEMVLLFLEIATKTHRESNDGESPQQHQGVNGSIMTMIDIQGDTPLLKASRVDASQYLKLLLWYDKHQSAVLIESKRKRRTALWYVASNELRNVTKTNQFIIPEDLRHMLLATHFALQRRKEEEVDEEEWNMFWLELSNATTNHDSCATTQSPSYISLTVRALISCGHLLGKYAVKLFDYMLASDIYRDFMISREIDSSGNYLLHHLCSNDDSTTLAVSTNALQIEQLMRQNGIDLALCHPNLRGNMPLHLAVTNQKGYIRDLFTAYPDALRYMNHRGELPLHNALKSKADNVDATTSEHLQIMDRLWKADPGTVEIRDGQTQLLPFQLAAASEWGPLLDSTSTRHGEDGIHEGQPGTEDHVLDTSTAQWLTLIFTILQAAPQVL